MVEPRDGLVEGRLLRRPSYLVSLTGLVILLLCLKHFAAEPAEPYSLTFDETFEKNGVIRWKVSNYWRTRGVRLTDDGVEVTAETMGPWGNATERAQAQWPIGIEPFELEFEWSMSEIRWQEYFQAGMAFAICEKPVDEMTEHDLCLVCQISFAGVAVSAWRGWFLDPLAEQLSETTGGGDNLESARWHFRHVRNAKLRFRVERQDQHIRWQVNSDTVPYLTPWIDKYWEIPDLWRRRSLQHLVVQRVPVRKSHYGYPGFAVTGTLSSLRGRALEESSLEASQAIEPFEPHDSSAADRTRSGPRLLWDSKSLKRYQRRWNDPRFAIYRDGVQRAADEGEKLSLLTCGIVGQQPDAVSKLLSMLRPICRSRGAIDFDGTDWIVVAATYDSIRNQLSGEDRRLFSSYLHFMLEVAPLCHDDWFWNPRHNPSNTVAVANAGAGLVALALLNESSRARTIAFRSRQLLREFVERCVTTDGGYIEGPLYWEYALWHYLTFLDAWRRCGIKPEWNGLDGALNQNHLYAEAIIGGDGEAITFGDTQPGHYGASVMAFLDRENNSTDLQPFIEQSIRADSTRFPASVFLWSPESIEKFTERKLPSVSAMDTLQLATLRGNPGTTASISGTPALTSHHKQADQGSVIYTLGGGPVLIDPGYYLPDAGAHGVIEVEIGGETFSPSPGVPTSWLGAGQDGNLRWAGVDSSDSYRRYLRGKSGRTADGPSVRRMIVLCGDELALIDWVSVSSRISGKVSVKHRIQLAHRPEQINGDWTIETKKGGRLRMLSSLDSTKFRLLGPRDFEGSWEFAKRGNAGRISWFSLVGESGGSNTTTVTLWQVKRLGGTKAFCSWRIGDAGDVMLRFSNGSAGQFFPDGSVKSDPSAER